MPSVDFVMEELAGLVNRTSADFWIAVIGTIAPVMAIGIVVIVLVGTRRSVLRRLENLETQSSKVHEVDTGPTVREFCRDLAASLRMRLPKARLPAKAETDDVAFIRGVLIHLKARRRRHVELEQTVLQLARDVANLSDEIAGLRSATTDEISGIEIDRTLMMADVEPPSQETTLEPCDEPSIPIQEFDALLERESDSVSDPGLESSVTNAAIDDFLSHTIAAIEPAAVEPEPIEPKAVPIDISSPDENAGRPTADEFRSAADSMTALLAEAILESQRLADLREASVETRREISEFETEIIQKLSAGMEELQRLDAQLSSSGELLRPDILRAEAARLALCDTLERIEETVRLVQGLIETAAPAAPPKGETSGKKRRKPPAGSAKAPTPTPIPTPRQKNTGRR
ncbi:MAG: hypothetical protein IPK83_24655 [Planctomycetes bacterium]|nr:hypothetical protein [Planctomycetota bacterium]